MTIAEKITQLIRPIIESFGFEYWGLLYQPNKNRGLLRIFIDKATGITVDDCAQISRQISSILDVENPIQSAYVLEVSSPGMDRFLFEPEHFKRYLNQSISLKLYEPIEGRRNFSGTLLNFSNDELIELEQDGKSYVVPFQLVHKAQVNI
jgi:ribosome maturation factor RimP